MSTNRLPVTRGSAWPIHGWVFLHGQPVSLVDKQLEIVIATPDHHTAIRSYHTGDGIIQREDGSFTFQIPAAHTREFDADHYRLELWIIDEGEPYHIFTADLEVNPSARNG